MTSINTNLSSLIVQKNLTKSTNALNQAVERLTTGFKINHASDNAANYSISESMSSKLSSYFVAEDNTSMGLDLIRTQSSTLDTIQNLTTRLRALAEQAHNGTYGAQSLAAINQEAEAIISEIERIGNNAEYNGIKLFDNATSQSGIPQLKSNGLMQEIERRDTSGMTRLADVDEDAGFTQGATYSISTAEELVKLATIINSSANDMTTNYEIVLGADIDLSGIEWESIGIDGEFFYGIFDGNGYTISNLSGTNGLFGTVKKSTIKNVVLSDCNISGSGNIGGLVGLADDSAVIQNCSVTGNIQSVSDVSENYGTGLLVGKLNGSHNFTISNCYTDGNVVSNSYVGGLIGYSLQQGIGTLIDSCFSSADVEGNNRVGGLIGYSQNTDIVDSGASGKIYGTNNVGGIVGYAFSHFMDFSMNNLSYSGEIVTSGNSNKVGLIVGYLSNNSASNKVEITGKFDSIFFGDAVAIGKVLNSNKLVSKFTDTASKLQVGVDSTESSVIKFTTNMSLSSIASLRGGMESANSLENIDSFISKLSDAQTKLGAIENRLTSTLESIAVNVENLTSSRSTLKDADVAKESSQLLKNQILQQASATLLATANQTPTLVLRLLNGM